jgi:hypothetical protein
MAGERLGIKSQSSRLAEQQLIKYFNYSRGHELCSHSRAMQHFMEPNGSLPHSQELLTYPCPEPDQSN